MSVPARALRPAPELPASPYPGLRPFEKHEWPIFFGRERMVDEVLDLLAEHRLGVVHGSSGCGKSSLIRAGVLPKLEQEHARHGLVWRTATTRPGGAPLWNLAEAVARLIDGLTDEEPPDLPRVRAVRRVLNRGPTALAALASEMGLGRNGNVCLLVDQFEELFRFARERGRDEPEILAEVLRGFEDPPPGLHAILTMRSDHLGDCGRYLGFAELVNRTQYLLPRMTDADLLRAIREPARLYQGDVTLDLALRLVQDSAGEADALPLVQHCLMRLWQQATPVEPPPPERPGPAEAQALFPTGGRARPTRRLDLADYPGLRESLSQHADEILGRLDPEQQKLAEHVFRALTEIDNQGRAIRRPRTFAELKAETGAQHEMLERIIARFRATDCSFITPYGERPLDDTDVIEIGHEALIRWWSRINDPALDKVTNYIVVSHDLSAAAVSFPLAIAIRVAGGGPSLAEYAPVLAYGTPLFVLIAAVVFGLAGTARGRWRYITLLDLATVCTSGTLAVLLFIPALSAVDRLKTIALTVLFVQWVVLMSLLGGSRLLYAKVVAPFARRARPPRHHRLGAGQRRPHALAQREAGGRSLLHPPLHPPWLDLKVMLRTLKMMVYGK